MNEKDAKQFIIPLFSKPYSSAVLWLKNVILLILIKKKESFKSEEQLTEEDVKFEEELIAFIDKINYLIGDYLENPDKWLSEWVVQEENEKEGEYKGQIKKIIFQPLNSQKYVESFLWNRADKILLMTATYDKLIESSDFGLNDTNCKILEYPPSNTPSIIEKKRRPILFIPQEGSLSKGYVTRDETIKSIAKCIEKIIIRHTGENGIIHCQSYDNANKIYALLNQSKLPNDVKNRIILQKQHHRNENLDEFLIKGGIFLSVCMTDGLDLKDSLCRYSVLACVPFANMGDERVKQKCEQNRSWYSWLAIRDICQAYGRAVRNNGDKAVFYILDNRFESLYKNYKKYFPNWFMDYIEAKGGIERIRGKYLGIKELQEYAALELTRGDKNGTL
jgi:Rad3-related DNA helicase